MKNLTGIQITSSSDYFKRLLKESGYTAETFTQTYNNVFKDSPISISAVRSWSTGRRTFAKTSAITVQRVAHILEDPDSSITDYDRYSDIMFHLING